MIRRSLSDLNPKELDALGHALNELWKTSPSLIIENTNLHDKYFNNGIHWGPVFLPWHRDFLIKFEKSLQAIDQSITLPFWDWTRADSRDLDSSLFKNFLGGRANKGGNFDHWTYNRLNPAPSFNSLPKMTTVVSELEALNFLDFRAIEGGSHVPGHRWTGGSMASGRSPLDPLFYFHHCNLDRIWSIWQINNTKKVQYDHLGISPVDRVPQARVPLKSMMVGGATPESMLSHTALGYRYDRDAPLEKAWKKKHGTELITSDTSDLIA